VEAILSATSHPVTTPPRVTVGMPVFNGERFLSEALDSALAQTFGDFEIVISDNASTDATEQICRSYAARDSRVRYFRSDINRGAAWNHNRVFELARGEYFKWWSHDDLCAPEFLQECVAVLDGDPGVVLCFPRAQIIDAERQPVTEHAVAAMTRIDSPRAHERFHGVICPPHWCFQVYGLARAAVLRETQLIGNYAGSDRVLLADLALQGRFHEIPRTLFFNREHVSRSIRKYSVHTAAVWYDPSLKGKILFPYWRLLGEHAKIVERSNLRGWERIRCYAQLVPYFRRRLRRFAADLKRAAKAICYRGADRVSMLRRAQPRGTSEP
jgi:glycosyltransferase involved in cell wall biosynthesis